MRRATTRMALLCALTVVALGAAAPPPASALVSYYNCTAKPTGLWCDGRANGSFDGLHSWDFNEGWFDGSWDSTVIMCQHVWKPASGGELPGASCDYNHTSHIYGNVQCACYEAEVRQYSTGNRNISGFADAVW